MSKLILCDVSESLKNHLPSKEFFVGYNESDDEIELNVFGAIGKKEWYGESATSALDVVNLLRDNKGKKVNVKINSPGGVAYDGVTIYNALVDHDAEVTTTVMGQAGSAAAIISQAADNRRIYANASFFIHRAMGMAFGNVDVMNEMTEFLNLLDGQIAETFAARTGQNKKAVLEAMKGKLDGTNYTAKEAKAKGYFDEILSISPKKSSKKAKNEVESDPVNEAIREQAEAEALIREREAVNVRLRLLGLDDDRFKS